MKQSKTKYKLTTLNVMCSLLWIMYYTFLYLFLQVPLFKKKYLGGGQSYKLKIIFIITKRLHIS